MAEETGFESGVGLADSAMVLAAGLGTRLHPLTAGRAKPVVPFLNRPLLDYAFDWLRRCGFRSVVVNLHHHGGSIRDRYGEKTVGLRIRYSEEEVLLGTAGGPRAVLDRLGKRILLVNGDIAVAVAPGPLARHHERSGALATLALHRGEAARAYPAVPTDPDGRVRGFGGAPADGEHACFMGVHLVDRRVLEVVPEDVPCGIVEPVYRRLLQEGLPVHGVPLVGAWYEVGTPRRYIEAQLESLRREDLPLALAGYRRRAWGGFLRDSARIDDAVVEAPFLLADDVWLDPGSRSRGVVAGRGAGVGRLADVEESVLWPGSRVGAACRLRRVVVLEDVIVPAGTEVTDCVWTRDGPVSPPAAQH